VLFSDLDELIFFSWTETIAMAMTIKKAPMVENIVMGSFKTTIDRMTATTISDNNNTVETEAERCLRPSSHK
jgi:hypothetical protein